MLDVYGHPLVHLWIVETEESGRNDGNLEIVLCSKIGAPRSYVLGSSSSVGEDYIYQYSRFSACQCNINDVARSARSKGQVPCLAYSCLTSTKFPEFWVGCGTHRDSTSSGLSVGEMDPESQLGRSDPVKVEDWPGKPGKVGFLVGTLSNSQGVPPRVCPLFKIRRHTDL